MNTLAVNWYNDLILLYHLLFLHLLKVKYDQYPTHSLKIPDEEKKVKISISVDPFLDKKIGEMAIDRKFYKKSRFIEYILKKYIEETK